MFNLFRLHYITFILTPHFVPHLIHVYSVKMNHFNMSTFAKGVLLLHRPLDGAVVPPQSSWFVSEGGGAAPPSLSE